MMPTATTNPIAFASTRQAGSEHNPSAGLTSDEARARLAKYGSNAMPDTAIRPWRMALAKI
jgi:H+-transporting ATPase